MSRVVKLSVNSWHRKAFFSSRKLANMKEDYAILFITLNEENKRIQRTRHLKCELAIPNSMQILRRQPPQLTNP